MRRRGMRRRGPGLLGTMARTAVVAGTASAVVQGQNSRRQAGDVQQQAAIDASVAEQVAAQPVAAAPPASPGMLSEETMGRLRQLAELRDAGVLSDDEFAAQKTALLG